MRQNLRQVLQLFGVSKQVDSRALVDLIDVTEIEVLNGLGLVVPTTRRSSVACESCERVRSDYGLFHKTKHTIDLMVCFGGDPTGNLSACGSQSHCSRSE